MKQQLPKLALFLLGAGLSQVLYERASFRKFPVCGEEVEAVRSSLPVVCSVRGSEHVESESVSLTVVAYLLEDSEFAP